MHADFLVLYNKNYIFVTRSVHCLRKNIELVQNDFSWMLQKMIKHFAKNSFRVFNWTPSDTLKVIFSAK